MEYFREYRPHTGQHKSREFWYNLRVSRKRDSLFDIVPNIGKSIRPNFQCLEYRPEALVERRVPTPLQPTATGKTPVGRDDLIAPPMVGRDHRARRSGELRKRIRRPQHVRNSVLVLPRKPLLSTDEARIRCCAVWQSCGATSFPMLRPGS